MLPNISQTEENYLKAIFNICEKEEKSAGTNDISSAMQTSAASVTDMLKRLAEKKLINYAKYKGVTLTEAGNKIATQLIRKHRLWETFLVEKLQFSWDKVHEIAEQLELSDAVVGEFGVVVGVQEDSEKFLQYLDKQGLVLGARVEIIEKFSYDESVKIILNGERELVLSDKVSRNLFIQRKNN